MNFKKEVGVEFLKRNDYAWINTIIWVKTRKDGGVRSGNGKFLRHGYEMCLVGRKGSTESFTRPSRALNVI